MVVYNYKGRGYCTAICEHCRASVTMTMATFNWISKEGYRMTLDYLDQNIPCCKHPDYYWRPECWA